MQQSFKRILLVRTDRLGDVILTLPMLSWLRHAYPDSAVSMLLRRYTGEIVEGNLSVDQLLWYDEQRKLVPFRAMVSILKHHRFDAVIVVHPTLRLALLMWAARIPVRVGTGYRYYSGLFNRRVFEHRKDAQRHELEYNLQLLRELNCDPPSHLERPEFGITIPASAETSVRRMLAEAAIPPQSRMVIMHPSSGGSAREWPLEDFGALANLLVEQRDVSVVVTGGPEDFERTERLVRFTEGRAYSVSGKLRLKELAALIRMARLFVSNSTGPLHLAVAVGTPVLAFYPQLTPMSQKRWGPYTGTNRVLVPSRPVDCRECRDSKGGTCACMESIPVEEAFNAACELLDEGTMSPNRVAGHG